MQGDRRRRVEAADEIEQGGLSRSGRPRQRRKLVPAMRPFVPAFLSHEAEVPPNPPLVSRGPSGLGGPYQVEHRTIVKSRE